MCCSELNVYVISLSDVFRISSLMSSDKRIIERTEHCFVTSVKFIHMPFISIFFLILSASCCEAALGSGVESKITS